MVFILNLSYNSTQEFLNDFVDKPVFVSRIGGSDFNAVYQYFLCNSYSRPFDINFFKGICSNYNGYFDKETNPKKENENFLKYLNKMAELYQRQTITTVMGDIYNYETKIFAYDSEYFLQNYVLNRKLAGVGFFECVGPLLDNFHILAENKKVLFISPFSKSIKHQYQFKDKLYKNHKLPNFELLTYNTPITYNDSKNDLKHIKTNNWFEQCELMAREISALDFDIAFLSCGSYAMYLGDFIAREMKKTSIYLGGVLNVLFGIKGKRFDDPNYNRLLNLEYQIEALEKNDYEHLKGGRGFKSEGMNAYF